MIARDNSSAAVQNELDTKPVKKPEVFANSQRVLDVETELWKPVVGYEGLYEVSNLGRYKSLSKNFLNGSIRPERILRLRVGPGGYLYAQPHANGKSHSLRAHRGVLLAFVGKPEPGQVSRHLNGINTDNRLSNLEWATKAENELDKIKHGTLSRGEDVNGVVLTEKSVREIRNRNASGESRLSLAKEFNVGNTTIWKIVNRKTWRHI